MMGAVAPAVIGGVAPAGSTADAPFEVLLGAMRAELAALDSDDAAPLEAATAAKLAALKTVATLPPPPLALLDTARALNALAAQRTAERLRHVDRRLRRLAEAAGRPPALCYGRDGRSSL